jgi:hypothetical protein
MASTDIKTNNEIVFYSSETKCILSGRKYAEKRFGLKQFPKSNNLWETMLEICGQDAQLIASEQAFPLEKCQTVLTSWTPLQDRVIWSTTNEHPKTVGPGVEHT